MNAEIAVNDPSSMESATPQISEVERQVKNKLGFVIERSNPQLGFRETLMPSRNRYLVLEVVSTTDVKIEYDGPSPADGYPFASDLKNLLRPHTRGWIALNNPKYKLQGKDDKGRTIRYIYPEDTLGFRVRRFLHR